MPTEENNMPVNEVLDSRPVVGVEDEEDPTTYLLKSKSNADRLLRTVKASRERLEKLSEK